MVGLVFKQQKYNILHEETEGYSKLNVILSDLPSYSYELYCKDKQDTDTDVEADVNQSKQYDHVDRQHRDDNNDKDNNNDNNNNDGNDKEDDDGNDKKRSSKAKMIVEEYISNVLSIIGHFDLDPNRVLDIIIDIYELHPYNFAYIYLLQRFRKESIVHVVGFKYSFYHIPRRLVSLDGVINSKDTGVATGNTSGSSSGSSSSSSSSSSSNAGVVSGRGQSQVPAAVASVVQDVNPSTSTSSSSVSYSDSYGHVTSSDTPRSLYIVTAMLIMYELIAIDDIIPYLRPSIDLLQNSLSAVDDSLKKQIVNYGVVSLTASSSNKRYNIISIINIIIIVNHPHCHYLHDFHLVYIMHFIYLHQ